MHSLLGLDITELTAIVNAGTVVILVFINIYYLIAKRHTEAAIAQAKERQRQADVAMENLRLSKAQAQQQAVQELTIVISMLHGVAADVEFWKPIVKVHWNTAPRQFDLSPRIGRLLSIMLGGYPANCARWFWICMRRLPMRIPKSRDF